jgi:hypothetical protein
LISQGVDLASLDDGFYQNNRLKATPYRDFKIRKDDMPDFSAVNFASLAFEEKLSDAKNKSFYLCKSSCKVTLLHLKVARPSLGSIRV